METIKIYRDYEVEVEFELVGKFSDDEGGFNFIYKNVDHYGIGYQSYSTLGEYTAMVGIEQSYEVAEVLHQLAETIEEELNGDS